MHRPMLRANARTESPSHFIALYVAAEPTKKGESSYSLGRHFFSSVTAVRWRMENGGPTRVQWVYHEELGDFWEWYYEQLTPHRPLWVWCDDLTYCSTLLNLWGELDKGKLKHRCACLASRVGYLALERGALRSTWIDRRNWWRGDLDKLPHEGIVSGTLETGIPDDDGFHYGPGPWKVRKIACLVCSLWRLLRKHDLGVLRVTASGQSLQAYRHRFGIKAKEKYTPMRGKNAGETRDRSVVLPRIHNNAAALDLEKAALHGGPVHCWQLGKVKGPVHIFDVQSLYPWAMRDHRFPSALLGEEPWLPGLPHMSPHDPLECVARVTLQTNVPLYPLKKDGITIYPVGKFSTVLAGPELASAIARGHFLKVAEHCRYELRPLFRRYVDYFWSLRQTYARQKNQAWEEVVKIILNSLHGKFAQRAADWQESPKVHPAKRWGYWPDILPDGKTVANRRAIAGQTQTSVRQGWAAHAFPAIAAWVYAYARQRMEFFFAIARAGRLYYSAIDSLHCDDAGKSALERSGCVKEGAIGWLRGAGSFSSARYFGPNDYELDGVRHQSGIPVGAETNGSGESSWPEHEPAAHIFERVPDGTLQVIRRRSRPRRLFRWGRVAKDGSVSPLELNE